MKQLFSRLLFAGLLLVIAASSSAIAAAPADFTLHSATSTATFRPADAKGKFIALHFLLKTECPYCLRHTREYFTKASQVPNVVQVFIKPDAAEEIKGWAAKLPPEEVARNPIYRDPDAALAKAFAVPDGYQFHGQSVHYPALILLGPDGKEVFRHVGKSNADRYSLANLAATVAKLTQK
jgi:peroxiredoxin Q/BCP